MCTLKQGKEMEGTFDPVEEKIKSIEDNIGNLMQQIQQSDEALKKCQEEQPKQFTKLAEQVLTSIFWIHLKNQYISAATRVFSLHFSLCVLKIIFSKVK